MCGVWRAGGRPAIIAGSLLLLVAILLRPVCRLLVLLRPLRMLVLWVLVRCAGGRIGAVGCRRVGAVGCSGIGAVGCWVDACICAAPGGLLLICRLLPVLLLVLRPLLLLWRLLRPLLLARRLLRPQLLLWWLLRPLPLLLDIPARQLRVAAAWLLLLVQRRICGRRMRRISRRRRVRRHRRRLTVRQRRRHMCVCRRLLPALILMLRLLVVLWRRPLMLRRVRGRPLPGGTMTGRLGRRRPLLLLLRRAWMLGMVVLWPAVCPRRRLLRLRLRVLQCPAVRVSCVVVFGANWRLLWWNVAKRRGCLWRQLLMRRLPLVWRLC